MNNKNDECDEGEDKEEGAHNYQSLIDMLDDGKDGTQNQSFVNEEIQLSYTELIKLSFKLGCISFGGPVAQQHLIRDVIVKKNHMKKEAFKSILEFCQLLPGYSSTNLLASVCTINTKSILGGLLALIFFNLPSLTAILAISTLMNIIKYNVRPRVSHYNPDAQYFNLHDQAFVYSLMALSAGIVQAALALLICATYNLTRKLSNSTFQMVLLVLSGGIYFYNGSYYLMVVLMIICGIISIIKGDHDYLFVPSSKKKFESIPYTGTVCFVVFIVFLCLANVCHYLFNNVYTYLCESFLRMGVISIGEGHVLIPMIFSEFKDVLEEYEVLHGYALISLLPGSILNTATYVGIFVSDSLGGLLSGLMIFIPGFMLMLGALPLIDEIKSNTKFQHFLRGANSAAVGFIFSCAIKLWIDSCYVNKYTNDITGTLNVVACMILSESFSIHKTIVLLVGASLNLNEEIIEYIINSKSFKFKLY